MSADWTTTTKRILLTIVVLGSVLRVAYVGRPFDHRSLTPWRQSDYIQIARNYYREGMNPFYPRIDWRGNTPGFVESELPIVPWIGACIYQIVGVNEVYLRGICCFFSLLSLILFGFISWQYFSPTTGIAATFFYAVNPILVYLSTAIQPESVMLFFLILTFMRICAWEQRQSFINLLIASILCGAAILAKSPAASIGLLLAYVVLKQLGWSTFSDWRVYVAGLVGMFPLLLWSYWSHQFWLLYGNSLGLSNESHFFHFDLLFPPTFLIRNIQWESIIAFGVFGWLFFIAAWFSQVAIKKTIFVWYGFVWCFYILAAGTSGDNWAYYYHCISVTPACLLMGLGVEKISGNSFDKLRHPSLYHWKIAVTWIPSVLTGLCLISAMLGLIYLRDIRPRTNMQELKQCTEYFSQFVLPNERIVVKGGAKYDEYLRPVAYNEPMVFTWMDRKGFNYPQEDLSIDTLVNMAQKGGRYWMTNKNEIADQKIMASITTKFMLVSECQYGYRLYDLTQIPQGDGK